MKAMVFAAGLGTRLLNETANKPKALVEVGNKPLLERAIEKLKNEGIDEIIINVHHFADQVISFVKGKDWGIPIHISDERDQLLETGGGLKKAIPFFSKDEPLLIYNVDILSNLDSKSLINDHLDSGAMATLVVRERETQRYFQFDKDRNLAGWLNKKTGETKVSRAEGFETGSEMAFSGIHIIQPEIFKHMPPEERFSIVQVYLELAKTHTIKGFFDTSELWIDVGKPDELARAREMFR